MSLILRYEDKSNDMSSVFLLHGIFCIFSILSVVRLAVGAGAADKKVDPNSTLNEVIQNGSFELDTNSDGAPDSWRISTPGRRDCLEAHSGSCSLMIPGGNLNRKTKQKIAFVGTATGQYSLRYWSKVAGNGIYQTVNAKVTWKCTDGDIVIDGFWFKPKRAYDWRQDGLVGWSVPCDFDSITVRLWYTSKAVSPAWFDDVSFDLGTFSAAEAPAVLEDCDPHAKRVRWN